MSPSSGRSGLAESLIRLAGTPDDDPSIGERLVALAELSAELIAPVSYAAITRRHESAYTTVATSSAVALAVDQAQYGEDAGPCLDALELGTPIAVPYLATTMSWPGFRDAAYRLGLRSTLSIPVFAGRGLPLAALNLYGRDPESMAPLSAAVLDAYDAPAPEGNGVGVGELDPGGSELVEGILGAFAVRAQIQQAIGMIIADRRTNPDLAYWLLRSKAAAANGSLVGAALTVITENGP